ncbi:MAG: glycosyltransferase family 2 protein [Candidatus Parcubacteria bacterium]|jgi:glycosyltransferase involved in cell wall biosynthesis|nr:MAG: glycosyltransferase family 2 protein [Candidatus Parcubacteria bacterium]
MKIACVIPAYNEAKNIAAVLEKVYPLVDELIVVDDHSHDKTSAIALNYPVTVIRHPINRGQGAALETGNQYALKNGADIIVHFDADDQFKSEEIPVVLAPLLNDEADAVFGSRFLGHANFPPLKRYLIMPLARQINRWLGVRTTDPQSGFRALKREIWEQITITNRGMAHCTEILFKTVKTGCRLKEVPIDVTYHHFGQKISGGFRIIKDLLLQKFSN